MRLNYLYRLDVEYPEGSVFDPDHPEERGWLDWQPEGWEPTFYGPDDIGPGFRWPRSRLYLSKTSAERRAKLLRSYGAAVEVVRSEPVTWPVP